jgi:hypothetical protein
MKILIEIKNGVIVPQEPEKVLGLKNGFYTVEVANMDTRTIKQNSAMHKYFDMVAKEFNKRNLSISVVLKPDIMWNTIAIKEQLWKPIQKGALGKISTTRLEKKDLTLVYDIMNKLLGERFGFNVPFPSKEELEE